jgi:hypothetical protein
MSTTKKTPAPKVQSEEEKLEAFQNGLQALLKRHGAALTMEVRKVPIPLGPNQYAFGDIATMIISFE